MFDDYHYATVAVDSKLVSPVVPLSADAPSILFSRKYADVTALSTGDSDALQPLIEPETAERLSRMEPPKSEVALVFGANGFVGAHLVAELSTRPEVTTVYAGVRASGGSTASERFDATVAEYEIKDIDRSKITVIEAVPTHTNFGLDDELFLKLRRTVDQVFNSASSTDYTATYLDLRNDWFLSLLRVLQFTLEDRRKHLTYMGSIGGFLYTSPEDFSRPDSWWYSGYCQMKWINGTLLGWFAREGLGSVTLVESPYVLGSTTLGRDPGRAYSFWRAVEVGVAVGAIWDGPGMNYVPVDTLVSLLSDNALGDSTMDRLIPSNPVPWHHSLFAKALNLQIVTWPEFLDIVNAKIPASKTAALLGSDVEDLIQRTNAPSWWPEDFDLSWWDHEKLFALYFSQLKLRYASPRRPLVSA